MSKPFIICLIDNDEVYQYTVTRSLKAHGMAKKILVFSDGEQAMEFLTSNADSDENLPDVIFLDLSMPIMDGWQFLEEYNKLKPVITKTTVIYVITSSFDPADIARAKKISEISDYIIKPIKPEMIIGMLEKIEKGDKEQNN